jgi:hypothetical protein
VALEGTFSDFGLADIFQLVGLQKKTGVLTVRGEESGQVVTVSFEAGAVTFADEYQRSETERLGSILLRSRMLTQEALDKAIAMQKETLQRLGHVLVQMNLLSQKELRQALQTQVRETVYRLFRWKEGSYHFSAEPVTYDKDMYQPVPAELLLMEGVRMIDEWPIIEKKITSLDLVFEKVPGRDLPGGGIDPAAGEGWDDLMSIVEDGGGTGPQGAPGGGSKLSPQEQVVYRLLDGERTVQDVVDVSKLGEFETCKVIYGFLQVGLARQVMGAETLAEAPRRRHRGPSVPFGDITLVLVALAAVFVLMLFNPWSFFALNYNVQQSRAEIGDLKDDVKVQRLQHALEVFYLEKQTYPHDLGKLVEDGLLERSDIRNQGRRVFTYRGGEKSYHLVK